MREIKFRAWDSINKKMDAYGKAITLDGDFWLITSRQGDGLLKHILVKADVFIPMQYTGLHDENGVEIYEGDIIRNGLGKVYQVIYVNFAWQLKFDIHNNGFSLIKVEEYEHVHWTGPSNFDAPQYTELAIEIIGNIYENPELLTPKGE